MELLADGRRHHRWRWFGLEVELLADSRRHHRWRVFGVEFEVELVVVVVVVVIPGVGLKWNCSWRTIWLAPLWT